MPAGCWKLLRMALFLRLFIWYWLYSDVPALDEQSSSGFYSPETGTKVLRDEVKLRQEGEGWFTGGGSQLTSILISFLIVYQQGNKQILSWQEEKGRSLLVGFQRSCSSALLGHSWPAAGSASTKAEAAGVCVGISLPPTSHSSGCCSFPSFLQPLTGTLEPFRSAGRDSVTFEKARGCRGTMEGDVWAWWAEGRVTRKYVDSARCCEFFFFFDN